jgi:hypothetical protein
MSNTEMNPVFTAAVRQMLVATVQSAPRVRRRWRWRLGGGMLVGLTLVTGGAALAAGVFSAPGAPIDTQLGNMVTATRTGTATIDLGPAPATATDVSLSLTCLSVGTFNFPNGSSMSCTAADFRTTPPSDGPASEVVPLGPGVDSVTITTSADASWTLRAMFVNRVTTSWGVNAKGETYGVMNQQGTPDLIAADQGQTSGFIKASDVNCASGPKPTSPAQALEWQKEHQNQSVSIPLYQSDGTTVIGTFILGSTGPNIRIVPLSSLGLDC